MNIGEVIKKVYVHQSVLFPGVWYASKCNKHGMLDGYSFQSWEQAVRYAEKWAFGKLL